MDAWFSNAVGRPCTLLRSSGQQDYACSKPGMCRDIDRKLNFVNEAQFLLISEESVSDLNQRLRASMFQKFPNCIAIILRNFNLKLIFFLLNIYFHSIIFPLHVSCMKERYLCFSILFLFSKLLLCVNESSEIYTRYAERLTWTANSNQPIEVSSKPCSIWWKSLC